jgi:hypothetical protein
MSDEPSVRDGVKDAYHFHSWARSESARFDLDRGPRYLPDHAALGNLRFLSRLAIAGQRHGFIDTVEAEGDPTERYSISIRQHSTPEEAHESLVDYLESCMAVQVPTLADAGLDIGDIGFGGGQDPTASIVFVRGSVLVRVDAASSQARRVAEVAGVLDRQIREHFAI